jgi:hypothetical protein
VFFIHCDRCHDTLRAGIFEGNTLDPESNIDLENFHATHAGCPLRLYEPTGRSVASGPHHEPLTERWFEVRDRDGLAVAIGSRTSIEEPLTWRIEQLSFDEDLEIALDSELFTDSVARALSPRSGEERLLAAWSNRVRNFLRTLGSSDFVVLYDDPRRPDQSAACLTLTARTPLEASLTGFGFDAPTEARLRALFNDTEFPPLRITRRITTRRGSRPARYAAARLDSPDPLV